MPDYDVIVVGGGPAGAVSARACANLGLDVLLIEQKNKNSHKPCGGVLPPICVNVISEALGTTIPWKVFCSPKTLGLYYIPPSGKKNSGSIERYRLLNIHRALFDQWLRDLASKSSVRIVYGTQYVKCNSVDPIKILVRKQNAMTEEISTRFMIGADGVYSRVKQQIGGSIGAQVAPILQETWSAEGEFEDFFYAFFRSDVSSTYAYLIPKDEFYVLGVGASRPERAVLDEYLSRFKNWLHTDFSFKPKFLKRREGWAIPFGRIVEGVGDVIFVGDAGGFCNTLSGEGIRLAIESGVAAGYAVQDALSSPCQLASVYRSQVEWISDFIHNVYNYTINFTNQEREQFVRSELGRVYL